MNYNSDSLTFKIAYSCLLATVGFMLTIAITLILIRGSLDIRLPEINSYFFVACFIAPVIEEFIFRKLINDYRRSKLGDPIMYGFLSVSLFALVHLAKGNAVFPYPQFILGTICWYLCVRFDWKYSILTHSLFNAFTLSLY